MTEDAFMIMPNEDRKQWLEFMKLKLEWARINKPGSANGMNTAPLKQQHMIGFTGPLQQGNRKKRERLSLQDDLLMVDCCDDSLNDNPFFQPRIAAVMDVNKQFCVTKFSHFPCVLLYAWPAELRERYCECIHCREPQQ
jgi:hypothetical protein